jgi:hypothetical protein
MCRDQPIEPRPIPVRPELRFDTDTTPQERWDCDILEDEGEMRFKSVVEEIKQACAALRDVLPVSPRSVYPIQPPMARMTVVAALRQQSNKCRH